MLSHASPFSNSVISLSVFCGIHFLGLFFVLVGVESYGFWFWNPFGCWFLLWLWLGDLRWKFVFFLSGFLWDFEARLEFGRMGCFLWSFSGWGVWIWRIWSPELWGFQWLWKFWGSDPEPIGLWLAELVLVRSLRICDQNMRFGIWDQELGIVTFIHFFEI